MSDIGPYPTEQLFMGPKQLEQPGESRTRPVLELEGSGARTGSKSKLEPVPMLCQACGKMLAPGWARLEPGVPDGIHFAVFHISSRCRGMSSCCGRSQSGVGSCAC